MLFNKFLYREKNAQRGDTWETGAEALVDSDSCNILDGRFKPTLVVRVTTDAGRLSR